MQTVAVAALDIHKKFSKAVALGGDAAVLDEWRIEHGDREVMEELFRQFASGTDVVMEATFNWPWETGTLPSTKTFPLCRLAPR